MKKAKEFTYFAIGDSCLIFSFFDSITNSNSDFILCLYKKIKAQECFLDVVPSYTDVAIYFDPQIHSKNFVIAKVENELISFQSLTYLSKEHIIPVIYDGEDLQRIAYLNNLEREKIISFHSQSPYKVAMIGFQPNFPYLIGLPELLETPRLDSPRKKVPAGSVAIGGAQTGIYPSESPGGWNLIGRMNPDKLKVLQPGDKVKFYEVKNEDQL